MSAILGVGAPTAFWGGYGYSVLGLEVSERRLAYTAGPLGHTINTNVDVNGVFLANVLLENGTATANMKLVRNGTIVADLTETFGVPEPISLALVGIGVIGWGCSIRSRDRRDQR